jgi:signal transduction histidine kinase
MSTGVEPCHNPAVEGVATAPRPVGDARLALAVAAFAIGVFSVSVAAADGAIPTTYASTSTMAFLADVTAGLALLAAGALAFAIRPQGSIGPITAGLGVAWLAADWVGWAGGPSLARSLAMVVAPFLVPLLAHLTCAYPTGRVGGWNRGFVAATYAVTAAVVVGRALVRDPFLDVHCWSNCTENVFLLRADRDVARLLDGLWLRCVVIVGGIVATVAVWRLVRSTPAARSSLLYVLAPAAGAAIATATYALVLARDGSEDPRRQLFTVLFFVRAGALVVLAAGVSIDAWRRYRTARAVSRLVDDLGAAPPPGSLGAALGRSLGDEHVEVAYWLNGSQRFVDAAGREVELRHQRGRATTSIVRDGQLVAAVIHDSAPDGDRDLERDIGAAARLAVDNERLRAEILAQLNDLQASRSRIAETADAARRRIERDLHDGAQQRMLAASYELRLALSTATAEGDTALVGRLSACAEEVQQALVELRNLAHGIFPAILTEAGLEPAIRTLADRSPLPVELGELVEDRFAAAAEAAAYVVVAEAVDDAARRAATHVDVAVTEDRHCLIVEVHHDGTEYTPPVVVHLRDRVGALGGRVDLDGTRLRAEIPCGS